MPPNELELHAGMAQALAARPLPLITLLRYRFYAARNQILALRKEPLLKIAVVLVLGAIFWFGLFVLFSHGFRFLSLNAKYFWLPVVQRILSLFFLALAFMLVFSNVVISFASLFKAPETAFLYSLPVRHDTIFLYKLFESLVFSSWAIFAIGLPLLLAYGIESQAAWYFYPMIPVYLAPFVMLPAAIGALLGLLLTAIAPRRRAQVLTVLVVALLLIASYVAISILNVQRAHGGAGGSLEHSVRVVLAKLNFTRHPLTPNFWITEGLLAVGEGRGAWVRASVIFWCALTSSAAFFLALGWFLSGSIYQAVYSVASAGGFVRRVAQRSKLEWLLGPALRRYPQVMLLVVKDIKTFLRDPAQWSQVLIFFGILMLYIGNLRNFQYPLHDPFYRNLIAFLNLGATCMTLATMTSRFVFPLISLEGHRFWVLGLVPIQRRDIVMSKFYFSLLGALLLTTTLVLLSNYILGNAGVIMWVQLATAALVSLGLSGLSVGMGALFPSFHERNPSKIVAGFGGTLTLILAMALVVFTVLGEGVVCHRAVMRTYRLETMQDMGMGSWLILGGVMGGVALLNILAAYIPMKLGIRALERVEF
jgi:ABC-2 type transport system permease protein